MNRWSRRAARFWQGVHRVEDGLLALALTAMVLLPLAEVGLRKAGGTGIPGGSTLVQHLVLFVSMLGGAVAARERRLLSFASATRFLRGRWRSLVEVARGTVGVTISGFLAAAGFAYVASTRSLERPFIGDIPLWTIQAILPIGFTLITLRIFWHASRNGWNRLVVLVLSLAVAGFCWKAPIDPSAWIGWGIGVVVVAAFLGMPIFAVLGGVALVLFWGEYSPIASVALDHYRMVVNPTLAAIPLFTLAGYFLAEGGASRRLIAVFDTVFGGFRGGPAIVTVLACAFFTSFTGASGVTILALGGLLLPVLLAAGYRERDALGLLTASGSLGLLFPPCLPLILYAIVSSNTGAPVSIQEMFLGGIGPGILLVVLTAAWGMWKRPAAMVRKRPFDRREAFRAVWRAKWELLLPVVALVALFGGWATPVEAAAVTALYAWITESLIYRDLTTVRKFTRVTTESGLLVGGVLLILGVAMGFNNYLIDAQVPDAAVAWVERTIHSKLVFLLALTVMLLIVGCLMDIFSAIVVVVPLIVPMGLAFGIHPVHLGIIFLANLELGYLTPPVGMNLFLSSYRFGKPMPVIYRSVLGMLLVLLVGVLLITYVPVLTTWLPGLIRG